MADEDVEQIGGIAVQIGASHGRLISDLEQAERLVLTKIKEIEAQAQITIRANVVVPTGTVAVRQAAAAAPAPIRVGASVATQVQAQQGQTALQRAINAELAKTGERYDEVTGEVVSATQATRAQRQAVLEVQQEAAKPTELNISTGALQNDLNEILGTLRSIVTESKALASLPAARPVAAGGGGGGRGRVRAAVGAIPEPENQPGPATSATFAPPLSQAGRAALLAGPRTVPRGRTPQQADLSQFEDDETEAIGRRGTALRSVEDIERRAQARRAVAEAQAVSAARTARTQAAGLGGIFGGGVTRERIEATADLTAKEQELGLARRRVFDFERAGLTSTRAYTHAREELTVAETGYGRALERVEKLSGAGAGLRNLAAVTVAGAAFGFGLTAINTALDLTGRALTPVVDRLTGFSTVAGRVTDQLSDQTRQAQGNAQAVVALSSAQAGLSANAAKVISPLVTEQATIEAGNKALSEAVDLFETYQKLRQQGTAGLTTQTGGFLGSGFFGTRSTQQELGRLFQGLPPGTSRSGQPQPQFYNVPGPGFGRGPSTTGEVDRNLQVFNDGLKFANEQLDKGGEKILHFADGASDSAAVQRSADAARAAGANDLATSLESGKISISGLSSSADEAARQIQRLLQAFNQGFQQPDPQLLLEQFNRQIPALISNAVRQTQFAVGTQQPVQTALQRIAQPNLAVGTGIAPADAKEANRIKAALSEANDLQAQLNAQTEEGRRIIQQTYTPTIFRNAFQAAAQEGRGLFGSLQAGAAAVADFNVALSKTVSIGKEIASIQEGISNEQAAYQTAQYNFQLQIARRTLGDIAGLTGKNYGVQETQLGVLERQNLLLSRQSQELQFQLSQRQINFQKAQAGFVVPGVTPEERQANIKEAQIEAEFQQKQLDLAKQQFKNQVKIVDISNLRQGRDLLRQIGLLQQGRQVTLDTAAAEQKLLRLNQLQQKEVQKVGTYIGAVDSLVVTAFGYIQQLEAAAGQAMAGIAVSVLSQFGIFVQGLTGALTGIGGGFSHEGDLSGGPGGGYASGTVQNIGQPTRIGQNGLMGEAADETLVILSRPRALGSGGGGGGQTFIVNFNAPIGVRSDNDIKEITRQVMREMGRYGSTIGLRLPG